MTPIPTETPNVVIEDPTLRRRIYKAFGFVSLVTAAAVAVDLAAPGFDISAYTGPALAGLSVIGIGIGYTAQKNTPA